MKLIDLITFIIGVSLGILLLWLPYLIYPNYGQISGVSTNFNPIETLYPLVITFGMLLFTVYFLFKSNK